MHFTKRNAGLFSDGCRTLTFPSFLFFANKRLVNHKIKTVQVPDMGACELLCYHEPNCVSINFKDNENGKGPHAVSCDLNNATHRKHDNEFEETPGYFYRGTEVNSSSTFPKNFPRHLLLPLRAIKFTRFWGLLPFHISAYLTLFWLLL